MANDNDNPPADPVDWVAIGRKIAALRKILGGGDRPESQTAFGERIGVSSVTVSRWERGIEPVGRKNQAAVAALAGMTVVEFFHSGAAPRLVPIIARAEEEQFAPDLPAPGAQIEHIQLELGGDDQVSVRVQGDSLAPAYRDGDGIIGYRLYGPDIERAIGRDCIVLTSEGVGHIRIVNPGDDPGTYHLRSLNPVKEDVRNARLQWAAPICYIVRNPT